MSTINVETAYTDCWVDCPRFEMEEKMTIKDITDLYKWWTLMIESSARPTPMVDLQIDSESANGPDVIVAMSYDGVMVDVKLPTIKYLSPRKGWDIFNSIYDTLIEKVVKANREKDQLDALTYALPTPYHKYAVGKVIRELNARKPDVKFTKVIMAYRREDEKIVTRVFWNDDTMTEMVCQEEDNANVFFAVAIAQMMKRYGSNSAYKKHLKKYFRDDRNDIYNLVALYETGQIYGGLEIFENRVKDVVIWGRGFEDVKS